MIVTIPNEHGQFFKVEAKRGAWSLIHQLVRLIEEIPEQERGQLDEILMTLEKHTGNSRG